MSPVKLGANVVKAIGVYSKLMMILIRLVAERRQRPCEGDGVTVSGSISESVSCRFHD